MNLANPNVFTTPNNADCKPLYKTLLCALSLPACNPKTGVTDSSAMACKSQCQKAMKAVCLSLPSLPLIFPLLFSPLYSSSLSSSPSHLCTMLALVRFRATVCFLCPSPLYILWLLIPPTVKSLFSSLPLPAHPLPTKSDRIRYPLLPFSSHPLIPSSALLYFSTCVVT